MDYRKLERPFPVSFDFYALFNKIMVQGVKQDMKQTGVSPAFAHRRMIARANESKELRNGTGRAMTTQKATKAAPAKPKHVAVKKS